MQLEDYFEFLAPNDIRVKGTRVGIETILTDYLELGLFAEQIAARYPTLSVEQVYATLTYYWRNRGTVDAYLRMIDHEIEGQRREQDLHPSPAVQRLRELARRRVGAKHSQEHSPRRQMLHPMQDRGLRQAHVGMLRPYCACTPSTMAARRPGARPIRIS